MFFLLLNCRSWATLAVSSIRYWFHQSRTHNLDPRVPGEDPRNEFVGHVLWRALHSRSHFQKNTNFEQRNVEITSYAKTYIFLMKPWSVVNMKHEFRPGLFTWLVDLVGNLIFFINEYTYLLFKVNNNSEEYCKNRAKYCGNHGLNIWFQFLWKWWAVHLNNFNK